MRPLYQTGQETNKILPDMALSYSSGLDVTTALDSSARHSELHGPSCIMALRKQPGLS